MSFNETSGKIHEIKANYKQAKKQSYRRSILIHQLKNTINSQQQTNLSSFLQDDNSVKQEPKIILPSLKKFQKVQQFVTCSPVRKIKKNKFFVEQTYEQQEEDQLQPQSINKKNKKSKSIQVRKHKSSDSWAGKLKKQQRNIILSYLNGKIGQKTPQKRHSFTYSSRKKEIQQFIVVPTSESKKLKYSISQTKYQKTKKTNNQTKQSTINKYADQTFYMQSPQYIVLQKQKQMILSLKKKVQDLQKQRLNYTEVQPCRKNKFQLPALTPQKSMDSPVKDKFASKLTAKKLQPSIILTEGQSLKKLDQLKTQQIFNTTKLTQKTRKNDFFGQKQIQGNNYTQRCQMPNYEFALLKSKQNQTHRESSQIKLAIHPLESVNIRPVSTKEWKSPEKGEKQQKIKQKSNVLQIGNKSFLNLRTYYAQAQRILKQNKSVISLSKSSITNPKIMRFYEVPSSDKQLDKFIKSYNPLNPIINLEILQQSSKFQIQFESQLFLYFGQVQSGKRHGSGILIKKNYLFEGIFDQDMKVKGIQLTLSGKYFGQWKQNKKSGKGEFFWENGQTYKGEWLNGKKHGHGEWLSIRGDRYIGQWKDGAVQGQGVHITSNGKYMLIPGQKYEGSFKNFLKSGTGKEVLPNGDTYQGYFSEGKPHGKGTYIWKEGHIFKGEFVNGIRQKFGVLQDKDGNTYQGLFKNQVAQGLCEIQFKNKDHFKGTILNGKFNGKGAYKVFSSNQTLKGLWQNDTLIQKLD